MVRVLWSLEVFLATPIKRFRHNSSVDTFARGARGRRHHGPLLLMKLPVAAVKLLRRADRQALVLQRLFRGAHGDVVFAGRDTMQHVGAEAVGARYRLRFFEGTPMRVCRGRERAIAFAGPAGRKSRG